MNIIIKLISVYLKNEKLEKYQEILIDEHIPNIKSCTIPTKQAIDIYKARARLPSALSGRIKGFNKLLEELDRLEDVTVSIHLISASELKLLAFTDIEITRVLGVLLLR